MTKLPNWVWPKCEFQQLGNLGLGGSKCLGQFSWSFFKRHFQETVKVINIKPKIIENVSQKLLFDRFFKSKLHIKTSNLNFDSMGTIDFLNSSRHNLEKFTLVLKSWI